ncbi:S41 family peptidase [Sphingomonas xinjiangensis]|uniref:Carboxyl-terminal processing protease n=1 Tax=Sphingomonas xinjiangensis TaxID=643568 RepID=A0A840YQS1_9SPHN|nr:S41 family peptidase [Sphingomonas xinjiangensis]MBB5711282.1 carboxyl-terminal processing protease [Sphingomonas xinjiangensis]
MIIPIGAFLLASATPTRAQVTGSSAPIFDAPTAWVSFERLLQEQYGYFDRPGVDGKAILSAFEPRAKAARSDKEFIDILQLVSHNFADPHFIVGPFDSDDWAIIPTASDLFGVYDGSRFRIEQVRAESDALIRGMRVGMTVLTIDGQPPRAAVEEITGRSLKALTSLQVNFAFNIALAGHRRRSRTVEVIDGSRRRSFTLAPTADQAKRVQDGPLLSVERQGALGIIRINNSLGEQALVTKFSEALASVQDAPNLLIDLRNTPSGGNTSVARGILGHFVDHDRPYQVHVVPYETRVLGPTRKFMEFVAPFGLRYSGKVYVAGGRWTGSMGEGMMIGFDAIGATTLGSDLAHLLGALSNETIVGSAAKVDIGTEQLFTVTGLPREAYHPQIFIRQAEGDGAHDPVLAAIRQ